MAQTTESALEKDLNIGIAEQDRKGLVVILTSMLADEYALYTQKQETITGM